MAATCADDTGWNSGMMHRADLECTKSATRGRRLNIKHALLRVMSRGQNCTNRKTSFAKVKESERVGRYCDSNANLRESGRCDQWRTRTRHGRTNFAGQLPTCNSNF